MEKSSRVRGLLIFGCMSLVGNVYAQQPAAEPSTSAPIDAASTSTEAAVPETTLPASTNATIDTSNAAANAPVVPTVKTGVEPSQDENGKDKSAKDENGKDEIDEKADASKPLWERSPKISIGGYVHTAYISNFDSGNVANEFRVRDARLQLKWSQGTLLDGQVEAELAKENDEDSGDEGVIWSPLRDAFVRVSPLKQIAVRMGQFRRPFSRIGLTSPRTLKLINRGISDAWVNGELLYGARDVGLQFEGSFGKNWGIDYAVGVFNGTGRNTREIDKQGAKDFVGRIIGHLGKHLEVAANVANKNWDNPPATVSFQSNAWMFGGDIAVNYKRLYAMVEGGFGDHYQSLDSESSYYILGLVSYKIKLTDTWDTAIEPLVKVETLTVANSNDDSRVNAGTLGANLYLGNLFRLMVQGDWIEPANVDALPSNFGEGDPMKRLTVQFALHTK